MAASALYSTLCCLALAISSSEAEPPKLNRRVLALAGACGEAAWCIDTSEWLRFARFVRHFGRSGDPVEQFCDVAAKRTECLERCPNEPPEPSRPHAEFKDAIDCFKSVPWYGVEGAVIITNAACAPCRQLLSRDTGAQLRAAKVNEGNRTLAHYVGMLNADTGLVGQACSTVRCALGCLESVSSEHCGDKKHGELVRELVRLAQSELGDVVQHLGLGCLVPDACKPSAN